MKPFFGAWVQSGFPPGVQSVIHTITPDGAAIHLQMRWRQEDGSWRLASDTVLPDGVARDVGDGQVLRCWLEEGALLTELRKGEALLFRAHRRVEDATLIVEEESQTGALARSHFTRSPLKQVIVFRQDLNMRKGKIAAQAAHASMAVFFQRAATAGASMTIPLTPEMSLWSQGRFTKVVLSVTSEADLLKIHQTALLRGVPTALITDSGKTEFGGVPTRTTVAVGPATALEIDPITGRDGVVVTKLA
jgi:PTH2 family peptidyl-tRNA hydrolase